MKTLLFTLFSVLCILNTYGQITESFDSFNGVNEWTSPSQANSGSHTGDLCFNITGTYLANEFYVFQSPIYDFTSYSQVDLLWFQESDVRTGDSFRLYFYDSGWVYYDISNLSGLYTVTVPNTSIAFAFVLVSNGTGNLNGKFSHVGFFDITDPTPLPVELLDFKANLIDDGVELQWSTASEYNSDYFSLYRAIDTSNWVKLIDIPAAGFSTSLQEYNYKDKSILYNHTYYRLKQTDIDGYKESWYPISVYRRPESFNYYNLSGQEVKESYKGFVIYRGKIQYKGD